MPPYDYNGTFTLDNTGPPGGPPPPPITMNVPAAPQDNGPKIGFENFTAPGQLLHVTTTSGGQQANSVEYMGRGAGEPSIGNNWITDTTIFYSDLQSLFVNFDDTCPANGIASTWVKSTSAHGAIGRFRSDRLYRFSSRTLLFRPAHACFHRPVKLPIHDDDGMTWVPTQGSGLASGCRSRDNRRRPVPCTAITPPPPPAYQHAVYYCSQEGVPASGPPSFCSRSDDGGLTFGPSIPLTNPPINVCGGLHGHVKVSPEWNCLCPVQSVRRRWQRGCFHR